MGLPAPHGQRTPAAAAATCTRHGRRWRIEWGPCSVVVEHRIGILHLAVLLAKPRQEIEAADLVAGLAALGNAATSESTQPVLDGAAHRQSGYA